MFLPSSSRNIPNPPHLPEGQGTLNPVSLESRVKPYCFVVLRSEIGSFDEIAWTKSRNDGPLKIGKLLTWDFSWMDVEAEIESAPEPCYLVKSDKKGDADSRLDTCVSGRVEWEG